MNIPGHHELIWNIPSFIKNLHRTTNDLFLQFASYKKLLLEISKMQMWLLKSNPLYRANQRKRETELIIDIEQKRMENYPNKKFWWVFSRQTAFLRKLLF